MTSIHTLLTLGRVSNLPTIWTNVLAAAVLAQTSRDLSLPGPLFFSTSGQGIELTDISTFPALSPFLWFATLFALSVMYIGGMFLNDAFDARWDMENHNLRPIVTGDIKASRVWFYGSMLMLVGVIIIGLLYPLYNPAAVSGAWYQQYYGLFAALSLSLTIILYNAYHKKFAHSAFIMGSCRFWVYLIGAMLLVKITHHVILAALSLLLYIAGLTYLARHEHLNRLVRLWPLSLLFVPVFFCLYFGENSLYFSLCLAGFVGWVGSRVWLILWADIPDIKAGIGGLLAAIPLLDALILASINAVIPSLVCLLVFLTIPKLHQWISGS